MLAKKDKLKNDHKMLRSRLEQSILGASLLTDREINDLNLRDLDTNRWGAELMIQIVKAKDKVTFAYEGETI